MRRRTFAALGVSACLAGCSGIGGSETIVDDSFNSTYRETVQVSAGQTLRAEVIPLSPEFQLLFFMGKSEALDEDSSLFGALSGFETVDSESAREITSQEDAEYTVGVGWFEDPKELSTDQYRLRITIK